MARLFSGGQSFHGSVQRLDRVRSAIEWVQGDLADGSVAENVVDGMDFVVHQAAVPSVQRSLSDPLGTNQANVVGTLNLLESSRRAGIRRFVYAASSSAYGDTQVLPKHEDMPA